MADPLVGYSFAVIAGVMAALLFYVIVSSDFKHKKAKQLYAFALVMTIASWSGLEWGLWLGVEDMFKLIAYPAIPLDAFFAIWISFALWVGEKLKQRKLAVGWLAFLAVIFIIASYCMNCLQL
jgi:hypothetical protein